MQSTGKFNDFVKLLEEQDMIPDSNRQVMGMKSMDEPLATNVNDFFSQVYRSDVAPENVPYPLNEFDNVASNAYIAIQNLESILKIAEGNAVIKNKKPLKPISKELVNLKKEIVDITKKVSKIK
tara:strand:+ start:10304 stop:10675 length:372 start_codon:yes stop_codon:yes gene_type:complete